MTDPLPQADDQMKLYKSIESGDVEGIAEVLRVNPDYVHLKFFGSPVAVLAAMNGQLDALTLLHAYGADLNAADKKGRTALMIASGNANADIVTFLVENNADKTIADKDGWTAEKYAERSGLIGLVENVILRQEAAQEKAAGQKKPKGPSGP